MPNLLYPPSISAYIQGLQKRPNHHIIWTMPNGITLHEAMKLQRNRHCCICRNENGKRGLEYTCSRKCYKIYTNMFEYFHWQLKSKVIKRDGYKCRQCGKKLTKLINKGTEYEWERPIDYEVQVDHIKPIKDGGPAWDISNMQVLCKACHGKKTGQDARKRAAENRLLKAAEKYKLLDTFQV